MDRSTFLRWAVIATAIILFWKYGLPLVTGEGKTPPALPVESYTNAPGFVPDALDPPAEAGKPNAPAEGELCKIQGERFDAVLSTRGAALKSFLLRDAQYAGPEGFEMVTTPDHERWRPLRTMLRGPEGNDQVAFDRFPWKLEKLPADQGCVFSYEDADVRVVKTVKTVKTPAGERPYELEVETKVTNLAAASKKHQLTIGEYAYRTNGELKGAEKKKRSWFSFNFGRVSPFQTDLSCATGKDVVRKTKDDFKSGWFAMTAADRYAAVNSHYFAQALVPTAGDGTAALPGPEAPRCELFAQPVFAPGAADEDDNGFVYQAKLVYPAKELAPQATTTYRQVAYYGPKERDLLAKAAGGGKLKDIINLGFFTPVALVLVEVLRWIHDHITMGSWGVAIILLTFGVRMLLFPLTWKSIKTTIAMRRLKPEVDALNAKFADDAGAKNLAMMELWKKHGVNPFGGCLPQLVQMPVWFAMYTTLQTAVEMYHTKFLWFTDMSAPDQFYVLPLLLGFFMIVQQRIVPQQGMDPVQQKMMMYMLPAVFTVMMLFLPAALGVYMLTNSVLGIAQQLAVEQIAPAAAKDGSKDIVVKQVGDKGLGKGKARV